MYLFVSFKDNENPNDEQVYFSISKDGVSWRALNGAKPVLTSTMGEKGVRDTHILRTPENKFIIIATDLNICARRGTPNPWLDCQTKGSRSVMIWRSDDLCNWSQQESAVLAPANAGCAWAPETIYDEDNNRWLVFWASKTADDNFQKQRIYASHTNDFKHFSEPFLYIEKERDIIDTTFIRDGDTYYRFSKDETNKDIIMEKSSSPEGIFEEVEGFSLRGIRGYEGPTAYRGEDGKWYLLLDHFAAGTGYEMFVADDIASGKFERGPALRGEYRFRHGTVIAITDEESDRLIRCFG